MTRESLFLHSTQRYPLKFWLREKTSDIKAVEEVIERNSYQKPKKNFVIEPGEHWVDLGANVGAFSCLAAHLGAASVRAYECDPRNAELCRLNIYENGFSDKISLTEAAVVADQQKKAYLSVSEKNKNYWRNSICKQWKGSRMVQVPCMHFSETFGPEDCVKMDIEGSEMPILEKLDFAPKKLVFEWSFDIDPSCVRFREVMSRLERLLSCDYRPIPSEILSWPGSWFPAAMQVFCRRNAA